MADDTIWQSLASNPITDVIRKALLAPASAAPPPEKVPLDAAPAPHTAAPVSEPQSPQGGQQMQMSPFDMMALQEVMGGQQAPKERTWGDTGKSLIAPLAVGLLSSLVYPRYAGRAAGIGQGIASGVGMWDQQRQQEAASRAAAQHNAMARAAVLARMGNSQAMQGLKQAQMEQTGALRKEGFDIQREGIASRENLSREMGQMHHEDAQQREADRMQLAAMTDARDRQIAAQNNEIRMQIAAMRQGPGGLKDKLLPGTFQSPSGPAIPTMKASQYDNPQGLYEKDVARFNATGEKEKAAAVMDERLQPLLYQKKSPKNTDDETVLIDGNSTLSGLDRQVKDLIPKKGGDPAEAKAFIDGKHETWTGGAKPLNFQDIDPATDSEATQAQKAQANEIAKRGYIKRYIDYAKYTHSYTDGMENRLADLLNNVGIARQQAASAAMRLTGSRAFGQQMTFFGAHIPNYTDPPELMADKIKNLQAAYNRHLFQAGRWNAIPKDQFVPTKERYLQDQGMNQGQQAAPAGDPQPAPVASSGDLSPEQLKKFEEMYPQLQGK